MRYPAVKRSLDVAVSAGALVVLAPVMAGIAVAVRGDGGPAIYRATRLGRGGRPFEMLKFRTMVSDAPDLRNPDGSTFSGVDDARVTPLGRWLRKTSLDELPQLWNVLRGDMSLVGPRPELPDQSRHCTPDDCRRLEIRPGITGLAQVSGRNQLPWSERRALDLQYVSAMSLVLDLRILLRTLPVVVRSRGVFQSRRPAVEHERPRD